VSDVPPGSPELYRQVLEAMRRVRGTTLARYALEHGRHMSTYRSALIGASNSYRARDLRKKVLDYVAVKGEDECRSGS
jgi:hypothetical protein